MYYISKPRFTIVIKRCDMKNNLILLNSFLMYEDIVKVGQIVVYNHETKHKFYIQIHQTDKEFEEISEKLRKG